ncbi:MAG: hypothetical protein ACFFAQ_01945 [Promethearchaeota archaeon]
MFRTEQTEIFDISENILYNLLPDEKLLYKLKLKFFSKEQIIMILFLFLIPISFIFVIFPFLTSDFFKDYLILSLSIFVIFPIGFIYTFQMSKPLKLFIYISNKKIYLLSIRSAMNSSADIVELSSLQAISVQFIDYFKDKGRIEFIYKNFKNYKQLHKKNSIITPPIKNISKVIQIIESIIWHYGNIEKRLEVINNEVGTQDFHEFVETKQNVSLKVYNDNLVLTKGINSQKIEFDNNFYLNYEINTLIIKSSYEPSYDEFTFGPIENFLDVLELIYLKFLTWKFNKDLLLHVEEILNLIEEQKPYEYIKEINKVERKVEPITYSKERILPFLEYLNKTERILIIYFPKKIYSSIKMIIIIFLVIIYFYFTTFSVINLSVDALLVFLGICSIFIFGLIIFLTQKFWKYLFTSQRIILEKSNKIYSIPYNNVVAVTYFNKLNRQNIEIHLKNPIEGISPDENTKIEINPTKKVNLFTKILNLRNRFYKIN